MIVYVNELNKDDSSHYSGACFHILVPRCDVNFNKVLSFIFLLLFVHAELKIRLFFFQTKNIDIFLISHKNICCGTH